MSERDEHWTVDLIQKDNGAWCASTFNGHYVAEGKTPTEAFEELLRVLSENGLNLPREFFVIEKKDSLSASVGTTICPDTPQGDRVNKILSGIEP